MRDIKFRAWDDDDKKWLLGYEYKSLGGFSLFGEVVLFGEWSQVVNEFLLHDNKSQNALKVMQYSGLKDVNDNPIYEGDIVYLAGYGDYEVKFPFYQLYESSWEDNIGEIKGNVHENPELLKGDK